MRMVTSHLPTLRREAWMNLHWSAPHDFSSPIPQINKDDALVARHDGNRCCSNRRAKQKAALRAGGQMCDGDLDSVFNSAPETFFVPVTVRQSIPSEPLEVELGAELHNAETSGTGVRCALVRSKVAVFRDGDRRVRSRIFPRP